MYRVGSLLAVITVLFFSNAAFAQTPNWTGWQIGVHGGGTQTNYSSQLDDANQFCYTETSTSGVGVAASSCQFSGPTVTTHSESNVPDVGGNFANVSADASATIGTSSASALTANLGGTASFSAGTTTSFTSDTAAARTRTNASTPSGTASTFALGLLNLLDLESGNNFDVGSYSGGGHIGYLFQSTNNIVAGFEIDVTALADNKASTISSDSFLVFNIPGNYSRSVSVNTDVIGSARLRLGLALGDFLPYLTGGIAYGRFDVDVSSEFNFNSATTPANQRVFSSLDKNAFGGVLGGGLSWRITDVFVLSAEGLWYGFNESIDISKATLNEAGTEKVELEDIIEGRLKFSVFLN